MRNTSFVVPTVLFNALGQVRRLSPAPAFRNIKLEAVQHALHQESAIGYLFKRLVAGVCALALGSVPINLQLIRNAIHATVVRCVRSSIAKKAVITPFI